MEDTHSSSDMSCPQTSGPEYPVEELGLWIMQNRTTFPNVQMILVLFSAVKQFGHGHTQVSVGVCDADGSCLLTHEAVTSTISCSQSPAFDDDGV